MYLPLTGSNFIGDPIKHLLAAH